MPRHPLNADLIRQTFASHPGAAQRADRRRAAVSRRRVSGSLIRLAASPGLAQLRQPSRSTDGV